MDVFCHLITRVHVSMKAAENLRELKRAVIAATWTRSLAYVSDVGVCFACRGVAMLMEIREGFPPWQALCISCRQFNVPVGVIGKDELINEYAWLHARARADAAVEFTTMILTRQLTISSVHRHCYTNISCYICGTHQDQVLTSFRIHETQQCNYACANCQTAAHTRGHEMLLRMFVSRHATAAINTSGISDISTQIWLSIMTTI